jgi:cell division protein FtsW (lipid II flippase)
MGQRVGSFMSPRAVGVACAVAATALGLGYMAAAGAPMTYLAVNALALTMGLAIFAFTRSSSGWMPWFHDGVILASGGLLLATALFGVSVEGASRWMRIGGLALQISLIVVPAMLVEFALRRGLVSTLGMILAAVAMAIQPDRAMAGVLAAALAALALHRRDRWVLSSLGVSVAAFAATLLRPDSLPALPYVDQILYTAFDVHPMAGLAVVGGSLLLVVPAVAGYRLDPRNRDLYAVFGAAWLGMVVAAALGNYPTPLVGYGGSAVLGYALSLAFMPRKAPSAATAGERVSGAAAADEERGPDLRINIAYG